MKSLKCTAVLIISGGLCLICSCASYEANKASATPMAPPKPITMPIGKKWKVIEEAPNLSDERGHVPFQTEQSLLPAGVSPVVPSTGVSPAAPSDQRKIETPR